MSESTSSWFIDVATSIALLFVSARSINQRFLNLGAVRSLMGLLFTYIYLFGLGLLLLLCEPDSRAEAALHAERPCKKRAADGMAKPRPPPQSLYIHTGSSKGWPGTKLFIFHAEYRFLSSCLKKHYVDDADDQTL